MSENKVNKKNTTEQNDPLFHDTWRLLKNYRDAVWNLELAVQQVRTTFQIEYGSTIEEFLDSIYLAGADVGGYKVGKLCKKYRKKQQNVDTPDFCC